jgi:hypothetical protein
MGNYTLEDLVTRGMTHVARLLITRSIALDTATYGEARRMLQGALKIERIFSVHPGAVVGAMMNRLWEHDADLPPLNVLMVNRGGTPGTGADWYISTWSGRRYARMSSAKRATVLADATRAVWEYPRWSEVYQTVFDEPFLAYSEFKPQTTAGEYGGPAESEEHKRLKAAIAQHPNLIASVSAGAVAQMEARLRSGDEVDVRLLDQGTEYAIEVKSIRSNDADLERGIYQAVKYRAVIEAQYRTLGAQAFVVSMLVTERPLPSDLRAAAKTLNVKVKVVSINQSAGVHG